MGELQVAIAIYAVIGIITLVYGLLRSRMLYWRRRGIPHKEPSFIVGNLNDVSTKRHLYEPFREVYNKFKGTGPFCGFYFLIKPAALILDLDLVKNILIRDFHNFDDRGVFYNEKDDPLTGHLFNLEATEWRKLRSKLSPTFTSGKMKQMFPLVVNIGNECHEVLEEMLKESPEVDVKELMARFTTDVIGSCAFGLNCQSLKDPEAEFRVMNKNMFTKFRHYKLVHLFIHSFPKLARRIGMKEMMDETHDFYFRIVRETVEYREKNNIKRNDFINMLIDMKNSEDADTRLNMKEITANAFIFFVAGFETSSTTMTFALYELALNQKIQDKARKEIREVLAQHNGEFSYECMQEIKYLHQIVTETLRKYSVVPQLQRVANADYPTDTPGYVIQKGTMAIIPVDAIQHDPEIYPEPEVFRPERFDAEEIQKRHSVAWLPFGDGPRNCIGMRFGQMQSYVGLATLLKNFKFTASKRTKIPMEFNLLLPLLTADGEVYLKAERI